MKYTRPYLSMSLAMRITLYMRLLTTFGRKLGQTKVRKFAAFKSKKFYIGFRPMQKLKQASKKRQDYNEQAARAAYERLRDMLYQSCTNRLRLDSLLPKK